MFCFREKVKIDNDKPYIMLKGAGKRRTVVEWDDYLNTFESATFYSFADNTVVKSISFRVRTNIFLLLINV